MPNTLTEWLAVWFIISVLASPFIGHQLHKRRTRIDRERCAKLEQLCDLADEWDAAPTDKERARVYRKAQLLGLAPEADEPFHLDEPSQPRPAA